MNMKNASERNLPGRESLTRKYAASSDGKLLTLPTRGARPLGPRSPEGRAKTVLQTARRRTRGRGRATGQLRVQLKSGGSYLKKRQRDDAEAYAVMLVVR